MELSPEKTKITRIDEGFDFLGQNIRKYKNGTIRKLLIKPSKKNTNSFLDKVRETIKQNPTIQAGELIRILNPIIRGWANYHRHVVSKAAFNTVDSAIFESLWQWARRRHPRKSRTWIVKKYFTNVGGDNWVFTGTIRGRDGQPKTVHLMNAASVKITRHAKIKVETNPYAPEWETYFEQRLDAQMQAELKGYKKLLRLWLEQNGLCPICNEKITKATGWHSHHIIYRVHGGKDGNTNLVLLHPNCHRQVHNKELEVVKPRSEKSVK